MSHPWMPLYVATYLGDTGHLSTVEHGAYMLLIMHYWQKSGLPTDDVKLARIARLPEQEWRNIRDTIAGFFDAGWRHRRIEAELEKADELLNKRSAAGKAGASARHNKRTSEAEQTDVHLHSPLPSSLRSEEELVDEKFQEAWKAYPHRKGSDPKKPARDKFRSLVKRGFSAEDIIAAAKALRAEHPERTSFIPQMQTWLHQERFADRDPDEAIIVDREDRTYVARTDPRFEWCAARYRQEHGRPPPVDKEGGWNFQTAWLQDMTQREPRRASA